MRSPPNLPTAVENHNKTTTVRRVRRYDRGVWTALTRRLCLPESGPEGPRTQRYAAGLARLSTATGTISLRADALSTEPANCCREPQQGNDRALGARTFWSAAAEGGQKHAPRSGDRGVRPYDRGVWTALTRRRCLPESGPEGPRTQRYAAGLARLSTATGTISLRADALSTEPANCCREPQQGNDRALGARAFRPAAAEGGQKHAPRSGDRWVRRYDRGVWTALTRRRCLPESGPEGPRMYGPPRLVQGLFWRFWRGRCSCLHVFGLLMGVSVCELPGLDGIRARRPLHTQTAS